MRARIGSVIVCLLSAVWLARSPDWEPLIAFVVALGTYFGIEIAQYRRAERRTEGDALSGLVIHLASYGAGSVQHDVTSVVRGHVREGRLSIPATNIIFGGDPCPQCVKQLKVEYSFAGIASSVITPEGQILSLP